MNRREWTRLASGVAAMCLFLRPRARAGVADERSRIDTQVVRLKLRHTWTTVMSSSGYRDTLVVRFTRDGVSGVGEGAPIVRYGESAGDAQRVIEAERELLERSDPWKFQKLLTELGIRVSGQFAAKSALSGAIMDWIGKKLGVPIYRYFGLDPADAPVTTFSIGIDTPEVTKAKVREAELFPVLKIKVGLDSDEATLDAVRSVTDKPLRVDANEGWKDKETAARKIEWLAKRGVELVEQPLPATMIEEMGWVRERVGIPVIADEACLHAEDIPRVAGACDGINVKLDKAGGMLEAYRMILLARALGLRVMLGCMVSGSAAITAAAHLSPLADYADLDGNLLVSNDPWRGVTVRQGKLVLPEAPGLGLTPADG